MYALVDCNNFYVSCERLFNPKLEGKPVIVLSNNDGCAVARSEEAKTIGIKMGTPAYLIDDLIKQNKVKVFSSNYTLYGDLSDRVMKTLSTFVPRLEMYSIDEAFLDMSNMELMNPAKVGLEIRRTVKQNIGIPVSVGIATTKTLAKMANRYAKKKYPDLGVFYAANEDLKNEMLANTEVADIWGIGSQYALLLNRHGFKTALDVTTIPREWMRKNMTVQGQRLLDELNGIPSIEWEFTPKAKKNICTSRSLGKLSSDKSLLIEAISNHAAACAAKLRIQKTCAKFIQVFLNTNPHKTEHKQYATSITIEFEVATNDTPTVIKHALKGFDIIYKPSYLFMKVGVIVLDLIPENQIQFNLFNGGKNPKLETVMKTLDKVNKGLGKDIVRFAVQGFERRYRLRADHLSQKYTTDINQILSIKK